MGAAGSKSANQRTAATITHAATTENHCTRPPQRSSRSRTGAPSIRSPSYVVRIYGQRHTAAAAAASPFVFLQPLLAHPRRCAQRRFLGFPRDPDERIRSDARVQTQPRIRRRRRAPNSCVTLSSAAQPHDSQRKRQPAVLGKPALWKGWKRGAVFAQPQPQRPRSRHHHKLLASQRRGRIPVLLHHQSARVPASFGLALQQSNKIDNTTTDASSRTSLIAEGDAFSPPRNDDQRRERAASVSVPFLIYLSCPALHDRQRDRSSCQSSASKQPARRLPDSPSCLPKTPEH